MLQCNIWHLTGYSGACRVGTATTQLTNDEVLAVLQECAAAQSKEGKGLSASEAKVLLGLYFQPTHRLGHSAAGNQSKLLQVTAYLTQTKSVPAKKEQVLAFTRAARVCVYTSSI